ncbi:non-specific lipid-transfer protein 1 [Phtheirospermum japonicum]|uniref:Non-specific lipid-transfer protein n=1 Tax=Phtheirospermum japonicum TaxID=374723 RepID=A0A830DLC2_9LAMI|nr:non-specific lipid-transfer protein 1 [Phtheirospermum japonicum]
MKGAILGVIAILAICQLAFLQPGVEAVTCGQVDAALMPCVGYLTGGAGPSPACCSGVKAVKGLACVKAAANRYTDLKDEAAQSLPAKCGVQFDIPISRTVDCDKIN